ncbi:hypothetical protein Scep_007922 [Stephania cephalantha]|uniref:Uncharacterized protein n=1 Tax=Stephania cephalantha TaxID=152367 RepID=A0AAP0KC04_9MAGN
MGKEEDFKKIFDWIMKSGSKGRTVYRGSGSSGNANPDEENQQVWRDGPTEGRRSFDRNEFWFDIGGNRTDGIDFKLNMSTRQRNDDENGFQF